ncbi:RING-H2 finger protein ATL8-like [Lycium ferocissimum]|uniref:RING-H2 finger protein ATL8-like n=1 Tax=Lycium ferocissimum TaxID=112874 RepID=UPI002816165F|nr:RING-H2 finger protein ATL8-like [Lycium ferocissimum]
MTRLSRFLLTTTNSTSIISGAADQAADSYPPSDPPAAGESDFVVILAALLCAVICVSGLIAVARCTWLRRSNDTPENDNSPTMVKKNKGLKKKVLKSLPKFKYDPTASFGGGTECAICLLEYVEGDEIRVLPNCGHRFHLQCVDTWLVSNSSCPTCRQILVVARAPCRKCGEVPAMAGGFSGNGGGSIITPAVESRTCASTSNYLL